MGQRWYFGPAGVDSAGLLRLATRWADLGRFSPGAGGRGGAASAGLLAPDVSAQEPNLPWRNRPNQADSAQVTVLSFLIICTLNIGI